MPAQRGEALLRALDESALRDVAARIGKRVAGQRSIHLKGRMGAGKTVFAGTLLRVMGVEGACPSPSYSLAELYQVGDCKIGHFDFFRCTDRSEWVSAGIAEQAVGLDVVIVEWPCNAEGLPCPDLLVDFAVGDGDDLRDLRVVAWTQWGEECCAALSSH